jgi:peptidoglycan hydrolase-like protein with peptidoglycan-binding domain
MNHALKAVIALVMGTGLAANAQAHGTYMHHAAAMSQRQAQTGLSRQQVKTAQRQLKADGLYKGKVDGVIGPRTRMAVARFQQRNGLQRTATLNRQTFDRLTGNQVVGVGSSRPKSSTATMKHNTAGNGAGSGSSSNTATPTTPPAANPGIPGAGDNTGKTNQSPTTNKY